MARPFSVFNQPLPSSEIIPRDIRPVGPPDFGANLLLKSIKIPLDNARTLVEFNITGDFLWAIAATDNLTNISVRYNLQSGDDIPFSLGTYIVWPFGRLFISNTAQAAKSITLIYGRKTSLDLFVQNSAIALATVTLTGNLNGVVERPGTLTDFADIAVPLAGSVVLLAANPARRRAIIVNTGAGNIRVGNAPAAATGILVVPNGSVTLMGSYAISAFGVAASSAGGSFEAD